MATEPKPRITKVILVGDSGTGKTSFMHRFIQEKFSSTYKTTIGADFLMKNVETPSKGLFKLQLWDTAGRERFQSISRAYYRGTDAFLVFYDTTNRESFRNVTRWFEEINQHIGPNDNDSVKMIIGTKKDLAYKRQVSFDEADELAKHLGALFYEVSAKDDINVNEAMHALTIKVESIIAPREAFTPAQIVIPDIPAERSCLFRNCTIL
jgi:small GTP-binding protein